jgi:hypothetical protein
MYLCMLAKSALLEILHQLFKWGGDIDVDSQNERIYDFQVLLWLYFRYKSHRNDYMITLHPMVRWGLLHRSSPTANLSICDSPHSSAFSTRGIFFTHWINLSLFWYFILHGYCILCGVSESKCLDAFWERPLFPDASVSHTAWHRQPTAI